MSATPLGMDPNVIAQLGAREHERAADLQRQGKWVHLWRIAGQWSNISIFRVDDPGELHALLESLPLHPYMSIEILHVVYGRDGVALLLHNTGTHGAARLDENLTTVIQLEGDRIKRLDTYISDVEMLDRYFGVS